MCRIDSTDLRAWSGIRLVLARDPGDPPNMEYHSAVAFAYEGILVGGLERMHMTPDVLGSRLRRAPRRLRFRESRFVRATSPASR